MDNLSSLLPQELICIIIDFGKGSKIIKVAKQNGITGATIVLGKGTVNNHILKILDITDVRKEIVLMVSDQKDTTNVLKALDEKFKFSKPHRGIAFTIDVLNFLGHSNSIYNYQANESRGVIESMYNAIFIVVDKGKADQVVDSAISAGSRGATVINGRGSGIHEQKMLFSIPIEPEKEIVLILAESNNSNDIVSRIRKDLKIDEPGMGILFTLPVNETYGLY